MPDTKKKTTAIPTIDVALVVLRVGETGSATEYALDTSNQIQVEPQTETTDAIRLVKLGRLLAQKPSTTTITGHQITLTDNTFSPEIVAILQGGSVSGTGTSLVYTPPVAGSSEKGKIFELDCYSAVYNAAGNIVMYEKITYPNCQGTPISIATQDDTFRLPEYVINSMPDTGEAPYKISYVDALPDFSDAEEASLDYSTMEAQAFSMDDESVETSSVPMVQASDTDIVQQ